jgi:hypothetical protein
MPTTFAADPPLHFFFFFWDSVVEILLPTFRLLLYGLVAAVLHTEVHKSRHCHLHALGSDFNIEQLYHSASRFKQHDLARRGFVSVLPYIKNIS